MKDRAKVPLKPYKLTVEVDRGLWNEFLDNKPISVPSAQIVKGLLRAYVKLNKGGLNEQSSG